MGRAAEKCGLKCATSTGGAGSAPTVQVLYVLRRLMFEQRRSRERLHVGLRTATAGASERKSTELLLLEVVRRCALRAQKTWRTASAAARRAGAAPLLNPRKN